MILFDSINNDKYFVTTLIHHYHMIFSKISIKQGMVSLQLSVIYFQLPAVLIG